MSKAKFVAVALLAGLLESNAATLPYQGMVTSKDGVARNAASVQATFSLYASPSASTALWSEQQNLSPRNGLFSAVLGSVTAIPDALLGRDSLYLGVRYDNGSEATPRQRLGASTRASLARWTDSAKVGRAVQGLVPLVESMDRLGDSIAGFKADRNAQAVVLAKLEAKRASDASARSALGQQQNGDSASHKAVREAMVADAPARATLQQGLDRDAQGLAKAHADRAKMGESARLDSGALAAKILRQQALGAAIVRDSARLVSQRVARSADSLQAALAMSSRLRNASQISRDSAKQAAFQVVATKALNDRKALDTLRVRDSVRITRDSIRIQALKARLASNASGLNALRTTRLVDSIRKASDSVSLAALGVSRKADSVSVAQAGVVRKADSSSVAVVAAARTRDSSALAAIQGAFGNDTSTVLSRLSVNIGTLSPAFRSNVADYQDSVGRSLRSFRFVAIPVSVNAKVTFEGSPNNALDLPTDTVVRVVVTNGTNVRTYRVRVLHRTGPEMSDVQLHSSIPSGTKLDRPYYPAISVGSDIDTTGLLIRMTVNGGSPTLASKGLPTGWGLGFASPTTLRASPWRNGVQIGPEAVFTWSMDSCIYDFDTPDPSVVWSHEHGLSWGVDGFADRTMIAGWEYVRPIGTPSIIQTVAEPSRLGTSGRQIRVDYTLNGPDWAHAFIGTALPFNSIAGFSSHDFNRLSSISFVLRDTVRSTALQPLAVSILASEIDTLSYRLGADPGTRYRWMVPVASGIRRINLPISSAAIPEWASDREQPSPLGFQLQNLLGIEFLKQCVTETCTDVQGRFEIDHLVYHFR